MYYDIEGNDAGCGFCDSNNLAEEGEPSKYYDMDGNPVNVAIDKEEKEKRKRDLNFSLKMVCHNYNNSEKLKNENPAHLTKLIEKIKLYIKENEDAMLWSTISGIEKIIEEVKK